MTKETEDGKWNRHNGFWLLADDGPHWHNVPRAGASVSAAAEEAVK